MISRFKTIPQIYTEASREFREYEGQEEERASLYIFSRIAASYMASLKMGSVICGKSDKYSKNQKKGIREPPVQD